MRDRYGKPGSRRVRYGAWPGIAPGYVCRLCRVLVALCLCVLLAGAGSPGMLEAQAKTDAEQPCSLTLYYEHEGVKLSGMRLRLYRVAGAQEPFALAGAFADYRVELNGLSGASAWATAASTLAGYAAADAIAADVELAVDAEGMARVGALAQGMYLVTSEPLRLGNATYRVAPFLLLAPGRAEDGKPVYAVESRPKASAETDQPGGGDTPGGGGGNNRVTHRVYKHWEDEGYEQARPTSVVVSIVKDGKVVQTLRLSTANNWTYSWSTTEDGAEWSVVEQDVSESYTVLVEESGDDFVITNSRTPNPPGEPQNPDGPEEPELDVLGRVIRPEAGPEIEVLGRRLPQTGQLWWPVPCLAGLGLALMCGGWALGRRDRRKKE